MSNPIVSQIPNNLLFRYRVSCQSIEGKWKSGFELKKAQQITSFSEFESRKPFADFRMGWNREGLFVWCKMSGKRQSLWCRSTQLLESDGVQLWIDTRDTQSIHRASKFCHWFVLLPAGGGGDRSKPVATMLKINRAKEDAPTINRSPIKISSSVTKSGYTLSAFIPAACLSGWDPDEHSQLGFNYAIYDRELGCQTLSVGPELPISEDPSLWCTLKLQR